ncbi:MAG: riboflavin kinase [Candidatus Peregrinibacteria bacterium]
MPPSSSVLLRFCAPVVHGQGRGRTIGTPTMNLALSHVPPDLPEGIYAAIATIGQRRFPAALHFGPRPVFRAGRACELHIIDTVLTAPPERVTVEIIERLRDIRNFKTLSLLKRQIARDIARVKRLLQWKDVPVARLNAKLE